MSVRKVPPIASNAAQGPLGICQLPRLWSKVLLDEAGLLPDGYSAIGEGFDKVVLDGLGISREAVSRYLRDQKPTYPRFEAWILETLGGALPEGAAEGINARILSHLMREERRRELLANAGIPDDGRLTRTVDINLLDDWAEFHRYVTGA